MSRNTPTYPIDLVIPWVDGDDPAWRAEMEHWRQRTPETGPDRTPERPPFPDPERPAASATPAHPRADAGLTDSSTARYRDWGTLRYWFRSIERCAPWVRTIHLVTWGHLPPWLDTDHPRLHVVNHADYIPSEYLPTFSGHPIELNLHRIEGLSEHFVYFNDDCFLLRPVPAERFFRNGLPCDEARLCPIMPNAIAHIVMNCMEAINRRHPKREAMRARPGLWFNRRYPLRDLLKTLSLAGWSFYPGLRDHHMPQPYLRSTFERLWAEEYPLLDATCRHRFRTLTDVNQYLMRYEQLTAGTFAPRDVFTDTGHWMLSDSTFRDTAREIRSPRKNLCCLGDDNRIADPDAIRHELLHAFQTLFPDPSRYER